MRLRRLLAFPMLFVAAAGPAWAAAPTPAPAAPAPAAPAPKADDKAKPPPAPGKPSDSAEAAQEEAPVKATPEMFDAALAMHYAANAKNAAPVFFAFLRGSARTADNYEWAQFFLAQNLAKLGFTHAAIVYYAQVIKTRSRAEILPEALNAVEALVGKFPYDEELVEREVLYDTDFGLVPAESADFVNFHKGALAYKDGHFKWAAGHFDKLKPGSLYATRARLLRAVHKMSREGELEVALAEFEAVAADEAAPRETRNEARVAAARLRYERKDHDKAHEMYDAVDLPLLDPGRGQIFLEKAWTYYQRKDLSKAMGLLLALDAPSFRDLFLPEKYILASFIYKDLCHFLPAKRAARAFNRRFKQSLAVIRDRGKLTADARLARAAIELDPGLRRANAFLDQLGNERDQIDGWAGRFQASGLTTALRQLYDRAVSEALRQREVVQKKSMMAAADRLLRDEEQIRLLDYEIGLDLYKRVKKKGAVARTEATDEIGGDLVAYTFDGEYWNDELRDYRFFLESRCSQVEADR